MSIVNLWGFLTAKIGCVILSPTFLIIWMAAFFPVGEKRYLLGFIYAIKRLRRHPSQVDFKKEKPTAAQFVNYPSQSKIIKGYETLTQLEQQTQIRAYD